MKGMLKAFRMKHRMKQTVHSLYTQLVDQARRPLLYAPPYNIEDTIDGRFSLILLHLFMVDHSMSKAGINNEMRRNLQETMINDMDRSLRELGVGDMSVGKEMKKVGATLLGCMKSYREAMEAENKQEALASVIKRNITDDETAAHALATYTIKTLDQLSYKIVPDGIHTDNIFGSVDL